MQEASSRTFTWPFVATLAAIGGAAAAIGVLLGWWHAEAYRESEIFGREIVEDRSLSATAHWSGIIALLVGIVIVLATVAGLVFATESVRRIATITALSGGFLAIGAAAFGWSQAAAVAEREVGGAGLGVDGSVGIGLLLSALGGLIAVGAGILGSIGPPPADGETRFD